jgi:hypothetical protein
MRAALGFGAAILLLLVQACASGPAPTGVGMAAEPVADGYPGGQCAPRFELEARNQPSTGRGTDEVVATYRPGDSTPLQLSARTSQESADYPASQVEQPFIACPGKPAETTEEAPPPVTDSTLGD